MAKSIIKELIISLLLCLAIILLLGILLYEYVPMTKTIPNPVSYTTPDNIKQELAEAESVDENKVIMTYEVDETDLNNYKTIQNYKPGKANPFSSYETSGTNTTQGGSATGDSSKVENGNNTSTNHVGTSNEIVQNNKNQDTTNTSGGQFFQDKGIK